MLKRLLVVILAAGLSAAALADDVNDQPDLKVDLAAVVSARSVSPVAGISSAGQPDEAALGVFAEQGYSTVIDLRTAGENRGIDESGVVQELGMEYIHFPIAGTEAVNFENARKLDQLIGDADGPVLIHCGSANRVGALLALRRSLEGADDGAAIEYGREGGLTGLEGRVRDVLGSE
jgi:uncharacterized protein (TIGR01244 family)